MSEICTIMLNDFNELVGKHGGNAHYHHDNDNGFWISGEIEGASGLLRVVIDGYYSDFEIRVYYQSACIFKRRVYFIDYVDLGVLIGGFLTLTPDSLRVL